jgi:hypothetical protein
MSTDETNTSLTPANTINKVQSTGEIQQFLSYLLRVIPLATDLHSSNDIDELKRTLNEKTSAIDSVRRFLIDPQCAILFIQILQQGKGRPNMLTMYLSMTFDIILDDEPDSVDSNDASNSNGMIQYEFATETTYAAQKGIR